MLLCLFCILTMPDAASADCISIGYFDHFVILRDGTVVPEGNTVILYDGPVVLVTLDMDCTVRQGSRIRLLKNFACDGDDVLVDDSPCRIMVVRSPTKE